MINLATERYQKLQDLHTYRLLLAVIAGGLLGALVLMGPGTYATLRLFVLPGAEVVEGRVLDQRVQEYTYKGKPRSKYVLTYGYGMSGRQKEIQPGISLAQDIVDAAPLKVRVVPEAPDIAALELEEPEMRENLVWSVLALILLALCLAGRRLLARRIVAYKATLEAREGKS